MNYSDLFITEVTKNDKIHLEDFIAKIWSFVKEYAIVESISTKILNSLEDIQSTSFYR